MNKIQNRNLYEFFIPIEVSIEEVDNIIVGALEGGINYWLDHYEYKPLAENGYLHIKSVDHNLKMLTTSELVIGLDLYFANNGKLVEDMDAGDYDTIIQYSYFGKVVYG